MPGRLLILVVLTVGTALVTPAAGQAAPGALRVLVTGNCADPGLASLIAAQPGVADVESFDTSDEPTGGTPSAGLLATKDLVVSLGDCDYDDADLWGNRLADYVDAGGVVLQTAYDNWDDPIAHPRGRFLSGGYAPLQLGPNDNDTVTLGQILVPSSPIVQGLGAFESTDNTTTALAPGATLLAKWSDGRNAIAQKGRVVATSAAGGYDSETESQPAIARMARNAGNALARRPVSVTKAGAGAGTVTSSPAGISCGIDCTELVAFGNALDLTATPGPRSAFAGWTGVCTGTGGCRARNAGSDVRVGAVFASTVRCGNPWVGTAASETLTGTRFPDRIRGLAGADRITGFAGADCLSGNSGNDRLSGGSQGDRVSGGSGRDRLSGGSGRDRLSGGSGRDRLSGGGSRDRLSGGSGNDRVRGSSGGDRINAGGGEDRVSGGSGNDRINVRDNRVDRVRCGPGSDRVKADDGDVLVGCETVSRS